MFVALNLDKTKMIRLVAVHRGHLVVVRYPPYPQLRVFDLVCDTPVHPWTSAVHPPPGPHLVFAFLHPFVDKVLLTVFHNDLFY